jgi:hypothetical protein
MQGHIGMNDEENERPKPEKAEERQIHIEKGQFYRTLQEKIAVGYAADGDEKIEQDKEIAEPEARADRGRVHHGVAQRLKVFGLARQNIGGLWKWRSGSRVVRGCSWFLMLRFFPYVPGLAPCSQFSMWRNQKTIQNARCPLLDRLLAIHF